VEHRFATSATYVAPAIVGSVLLPVAAHVLTRPSYAAGAALEAKRR
jgi:hypothetical protein